MERGHTAVEVYVTSSPAFAVDDFIRLWLTVCHELPNARKRDRTGSGASAHPIGES